MKQKRKKEEGHVKNTTCGLCEVGLVLDPISRNLSRAQRCSPACLGGMCQRESSCWLFQALHLLWGELTDLSKSPAQASDHTVMLGLFLLRSLKYSVPKQPDTCLIDFFSDANSCVSLQTFWKAFFVIKKARSY